MEEKYISVKEAAKRLGLKYSQVIRMIRSGKLKATKAEGGWGWLIEVSEINK